MAANSETGNGDEPEKTRRAPHHAMRDAERESLNFRANKDRILPSRLFAIFAGLDKPTAEEQQLLEDNPRCRELAEQMMSSFKDLQTARAKKRDDPGTSR